MIDLLKVNLLQNNFLQLINENTRTHKILDHVYANTISKVHNTYVESDSPTDHKFIVLEKR